MDQDLLWRALEYSGWTGWGGALAAGLLVCVAAFGAVYYARTPLLTDRGRREAKFWLSQPAGRRHGYRGVLFSDETLWAFVGWAGFYFVRRLTVGLRHEKPARNKTLFRCEENPNTHSLDDTIRAFSLWIKAAEQHGVPAFYRAGRNLHSLTAEQMEEMKADPVAFVARFQEHIARGMPLA